MRPLYHRAGASSQVRWLLPDGHPRELTETVLDGLRALAPSDRRVAHARGADIVTVGPDPEGAVFPCTVADAHGRRVVEPGDLELRVGPTARVEVLRRVTFTVAAAGRVRAGAARRSRLVPGRGTLAARLVRAIRRAGRRGGCDSGVDPRLHPSRAPPTR